MAERPDLEYQVPLLRAGLVGKTMLLAKISKPLLVRALIESGFAQLHNSIIKSVDRRGHFVEVSFENTNVHVAFAPMLAGKFAWAESKKPPGDLALTWHLSDGPDLWFRDDVQMAKVYVYYNEQRSEIPGLAKVGVDVLSPAFSEATLGRLAKGRRDQVRVFLMDKETIDSFGNAYADETLFAAQIHPKTWVRALSEDDISRLARAMKSVLQSATEELERRTPAIHEKLRDFLQVRNRHKSPCPRCGTLIRKTQVHGYDSFFCPSCQPETRKSGVVAWSSLPAKDPQIPSKATKKTGKSSKIK